MQLIEYSVNNFRSITSAHKIALSSMTVLVGKNNEGKSNLLLGLETAMSILEDHAYDGPRRGKRFLISNPVGVYNWYRDFPIQLQNRKSNNHTKFRLTYKLNEQECAEFKEAVGATLNGLLPVEIQIGRDQLPSISLVKPGKNTKALAAKSTQIAAFITSRTSVNYIPAIRTEANTLELVSKMVSEEINSLESDLRYIKALKVIEELQAPILESLAKRIEEPLKKFLPNINSVKIEISTNKRRFSLGRSVDIIIDDGTATNIEHKGDGVKSLAALGILKDRKKTSASILAIEEPEAHLHPEAIHQISEIINALSIDSQVIVATHNPIFVDRNHIKNNVLVSSGSARPAKNIAQIREILGVKVSDNLSSANHVLVVEGITDATAITPILHANSDKISKALKANHLVIEPMNGCSKLSYKLQQLKLLLCVTHTLLDGDEAGKNAYKFANQESLLSQIDSTLILCKGHTESELEDCLQPSVYKDIVLNEFGVDLECNQFKGNRKFSHRLEAAFHAQGKLLEAKDLEKIKLLIAEAVTRKPNAALDPQKRAPLDSLIVSLERMLG